MLDAVGAGLLASADAEAAEDQGSVYIPQAHRVQDLRLMQDFMSEFAFGMLITASPSIRVTHLPIVYEPGKGKYGRLIGHVARNNPQHKLFTGDVAAVIVFRGPHGYVSPVWMKRNPAVPTWNFAVVHASGRPRAITDKAETEAALTALVNKFEAYEGTEWSLAKVPQSYKDGMIGGIQAFTMDIDDLEGKFKLGQDRTPEDRASVLAHLSEGKPERSLAEFSRAYFKDR